jgi:hypothetical protein
VRRGSANLGVMPHRLDGSDARKRPHVRAAGILAWRLDTGSSKRTDPLDPISGVPTFAVAEKMWALMSAGKKG